MSPNPHAVLASKKPTSSPTTKARKKKSKESAFKVRFAPVSATQAAQGRTARADRAACHLPASRIAADVQIDKLFTTGDQRAQLDGIYRNQEAYDHQFVAQDTQSQVAAAALLASHGLDLDSREDPANRWSTKWSLTRGKGAEEVTRVLYQW